MAPLLKIRGKMPDWVQFSSIDEKAEMLHVVASPLLGGGVIGESYPIVIKDASGNVKVSEVSPGTKLPSACPERHINSDGTFCIGLNAGKNITTAVEAESWWDALASFFRCQNFAAKRGYWPREHWLSHGDAAEDHLAMEKIAEGLGDEWEKEIKLALEYREGWLGGELPRHRKNSDMLVNQRLPCPRGCSRKKGKHILPVARRKCSHKQQVSQLVWHENERRRKEAAYINDLISKGFKCCGSMKNCPFRQST
jgi:hypothetical protein